MITIAQLFDEYRQKVMSASAGPVQINETRRAFYAGSFVMITFLRDVVGAEETPAHVGAEMLEALERECIEYRDDATTAAAAVTPADVNYTIADPHDIAPILKDLGARIAAALPSAGWGFALFIFSYGPGGSMFYVSSAQRADLIASLKEFINRQTQ